MNQILLTPTDLLFFRDGRPMEGALSGHGAAWPLPHVINAAFHAALHRSEIGEDAHIHRTGCSGQYDSEHRDRKFGSLVTAGPFPVISGDSAQTCWLFPRPADAQKAGSQEVTLHPKLAQSDCSSLPKPLTYLTANSQPPTKDKPEPWISLEAFLSYLNGTPLDSKRHFYKDAELFDAEHQIGIGIDSETGTTGSENAEGQIYSASYLRLREGCHLGVMAEALDKINRDPKHRRDLVPMLFRGDNNLVVGGQQKLCTATVQENGCVPFPFGATITGTRVKWVLLSPAIWPEIAAGQKNETLIKAHPGGWLPNWVCPETGMVQLLDGPGREKAKRLHVQAGLPIDAKLVAAIVPKPVVITGWALGNQTGTIQSGAKSTHLAVPAGAVYYFETGSACAALALAQALNWHGPTGSKEIQNRRSTLCGEKGFGLGVCAPWFPIDRTSANVQ